MLPPDVISAFAALFMVGMLWLRTGMHYAKGTRSVRALTTAGRGTTLPRRRGLQFERGQKRCAGDAPLRVRLMDTSDGGTQVIVGVLGLPDERIQVVRLEAAPPVRRGPE